MHIVKETSPVVTPSPCLLSFGARTLIAHLRAALPFVSTDKTRPHINALLLDVAPKFARFVATDSHTIWIAGAPTKEQSGTDTRIVPAADVKRLLKSLDRKGPDVSIAFTQTGLSVVQGPTHLDIRQPPGVTFPPYAQVLPTVLVRNAARVPTAVNGAYLGRAGGSFALLAELQQARVCGVIVDNGAGELDPVIVTSPAVAGAIAILMPMRSADLAAVTLASLRGCSVADVKDAPAPETSRPRKKKSA